MEIRECCHAKAKENIVSAQERQKKAKRDSLKVNCECHAQPAACLRHGVYSFMLHTFIFIAHFFLQVYPVGTMDMLKNMANSDHMGEKKDGLYMERPIHHQGDSWQGQIPVDIQRRIEEC